MPRWPRDQAMEFDVMNFADSMLDGCYGDGGGEGEFRKEQSAAAAEKGEERYKSKNLAAERRRRSKLNHRLFTLRSLVPNITKMSKESTLIDAMDYIHNLQTQINDLKLELSKICEEEDRTKQGSTSSTESTAPPEMARYQGRVELNPMGQNKFHVKIMCNKRPGGFIKLLDALSRNGLEITEISSFAFSGFDQIVFCIEARGDKEIPISELRKLLMAIVEVSEENNK
ncbi:uncharacterized protein A4U43_C03F9080 [Asparagus officinalis]|uniref:BHLH domain-containing protein n=1 Tax=Asparagus officinalis TaxID=4686 RepID=A0A5P1F9B6_ASPOF|nr:transcription factor UDT1-like [Asparagus officinalis]ONK74684.1 uncharacterized protein A4U43_C03F9080 [Asparagus officinalis]